MTTEACILTSKDFTILEAMRGRCLGKDDPLAPLLKEKVENARVVFAEDVPSDVATLDSRVTFSVDGRDPDTRILSSECMTSPVGMSLPINLPRGLALLGLTEGQTFVLTDQNGREERVLLEKVLYQPEAARREKEALATSPAPVSRKPSLRLIRGDFVDQPRLQPAGSGGFDDPGPSAA